MREEVAVPAVSLVHISDPEHIFVVSSAFFHIVVALVSGESCQCKVLKVLDQSLHTYLVIDGTDIDIICAIDIQQNFSVISLLKRAIVPDRINHDHIFTLGQFNFVIVKVKQEVGSRVSLYKLSVFSAQHNAEIARLELLAWVFVAVAADAIALLAHRYGKNVFVEVNCAIEFE